MLFCTFRQKIIKNLHNAWLQIDDDENDPKLDELIYKLNNELLSPNINNIRKNFLLMNRLTIRDTSGKLEDVKQEIMDILNK